MIESTVTHIPTVCLHGGDHAVVLDCSGEIAPDKIGHLAYKRLSCIAIHSVLFLQHFRLTLLALDGGNFTFGFDDARQNLVLDVLDSLLQASTRMISLQRVRSKSSHMVIDPIER